MNESIPDNPARVDPPEYVELEDDDNERCAECGELLPDCECYEIEGEEDEEDDDN